MTMRFQLKSRKFYFWVSSSICLHFWFLESWVSRCNDRWSCCCCCCRWSMGGHVVDLQSHVVDLQGHEVRSRVGGEALRVRVGEVGKVRARLSWVRSETEVESRSLIVNLQSMVALWVAASLAGPTDRKKQDSHPQGLNFKDSPGRMKPRKLP
jgi:hypothetical protein